MILSAKEITIDKIGWETDSKDCCMHIGNRQKVPIPNSTINDFTSGEGN